MLAVLVDLIGYVWYIYLWIQYELMYYYFHSTSTYHVLNCLDVFQLKAIFYKPNSLCCIQSSLRNKVYGMSFTLGSSNTAFIAIS